MKFKQYLEKIKACEEAVQWVNNRSLKQAWEKCDRGDWMLWFAQKQQIDLKILILAKIECASLIKHLMKDKRSLNALKIAKKFAKGKATEEELKNAAAAAYAAAAAATTDAAAAAAATAAAAAATTAAAYADAAAAATAAYAAYAAATAAAYAATAYAYAADAAATAAAYAATAYADAVSKIKSKAADICRKTIPLELLEKF